jgi:hypothetical protein
MFLSSKYTLVQLFPLISRGFLFDLLTYGHASDIICYFYLIIGFGRRRHTSKRKCDYGDP